ncbi:hypothetical protein BRC90_08845 [Halobacteriales archaeon QS_4_69_34]|nr:MAG: hypothetical protein BRC90_08845 [Halobacteriales archaeon QS_4_69_34]
MADGDGGKAKQSGDGEGGAADGGAGDDGGGASDGGDGKTRGGDGNATDGDAGGKAKRSSVAAAVNVNSAGIGGIGALLVVGFAAGAPLARRSRSEG